MHNQIGKFSGQIDTPLVEEGIEQARKSAEVLKTYNIDAIVSSPLQRAHDTARIVAKIIGYPEDRIEVSSLLLERNFGILEGTPYQPGIVFDDVEGAESLEELVERAKKSLEWLRNIKANNILLVSHGSYGRALNVVLSDDIKSFNKIKFHNAEVIELL